MKIRNLLTEDSLLVVIALAFVSTLVIGAMAKNAEAVVCKPSGSDVTLSWTYGTDPQLAGFNLYVSYNGPDGDYILVDEVDPEARADTLVGLLDGSYWFRATARDFCYNESVPSNATDQLLLGDPKQLPAPTDLRIEASSP